MNNRLHPLTIGFFIFVMNIYSQDLPQILPPSPEVSSFNKFVDMPVSMATGIPIINVPIYSINLKGYNLPINLSYHASGIKVEEIASSVGLGWSLIAGGSVSRMTRDMPDDGGNNNNYIDTQYTINYLRQVQDLYNEFSIQTGNASAIRTQYGLVNTGDRDYQPDIFTFNFPGYSGKLLYDQSNSNFVQLPYSNLRIIPVFENDVITSWKFTTPEGYTYVFGKTLDGTREAIDLNKNFSTYTLSNPSYIPSSGLGTPNHISAWHLLQIISPNNDEINFNYQQNPLVYQFIRAGEQYNFTQCTPGKYSATFLEGLVSETILSSITFPNGSVDFTYDSTSRLDLSGAYRLKEITISNDSQVLKKFKLNHNYFTANSNTDAWPNEGDVNVRLKRLYLDSIVESSNNEELPPYVFEYNTVQNLPSRFSNGQDYWGYYNGEDSNDELIPESQITSTIFTYDNDRTVDTLKNQANILKKITYPTGGSTEYFYEANRALKTAITTDTPNMEYNLKNRHDNSGNLIGLSKSSEIDPNEFITTYYEELDLQNILGTIQINITVTGCDNSQPLTNFACDYFFKIKGVTNPSYEVTLSSNSYNITLPAGIYIAQAIENNSGGDFQVTFNWETSDDSDFLYLGGVRVSKIITSDGDGNTLEKQFDYSFFDNDDSSGYAISTPTFIDDDMLHLNENGCTSMLNYKITSNTQIPGVLINGNTMAYRNVTEINKDLSKTEYTFSSLGDYFDSAPGFNNEVNTPDVDVNWRRGVLTDRSDYSYNGTYNIVSKEHNEYESYGTYPMLDLGVVFDTQTNAVKFSYYSAISEWYRIKQSIKTNYFSQGDLIKTTNFSYDNNPLLPSETITTTSDEEKTMVTKTYYPNDIITTNSLGYDPLASITPINNLKSQNRIGEPIQVETKIKDSQNNVLSNTVQRTNYFVASGLTLPKDIQTLKGTYNSNSNALEKPIIYHSYYTNGNVKEVSMKDGSHVVYIWGYQEQYPIAKIENASFSDIPTSVYNSIVSASNADINSVSEDDLRTELEKLRNTSYCPNLSNAMVTTYTYNPLIGVTSSSDSRGQTSYFHYDKFNRLENIKNNNGKIVNQYEYHYKAQ